jgi:hypothetical protein
VVENLLEGDSGILFWMNDEGVVMTIGAPEITMGQEKDRTDFPWPIHKGSF